MSGIFNETDLIWYWRYHPGDEDGVSEDEYSQSQTLVPDHVHSKDDDVLAEFADQLKCSGQPTSTATPEEHATVSPEERRVHLLSLYQSMKPRDPLVDLLIPAVVSWYKTPDKDE